MTIISGNMQSMAQGQILATIAPLPTEVAPPSTGPLKAYSPANLNATYDTASKYYRPQASSWNGDQIWAISAAQSSSYIPVSSVTPNPVNQINIALGVQNRLGEIGFSGVTDLEPTPMASTYSDLNVAAAGTMTFSKSGATVNSGLFWLDLGSAASKTYSLKFENFTFTPFDVAAGSGTPGAITPVGAVKSVTLTGFTNASDWEWNASSQGFSFAWSRPNASNAANIDVVLDFFDATGSLKNTQTVMGLSNQTTFMMVDDLNASPSTGSGFYLCTIDQATSTISFVQKYTSAGAVVSGFTPLSFVTLFDVGGVKAATIAFTNYNSTTTSYQNAEFAVSGLRGGKNVVDFYKTDANLTPLVTQEISLSGAVVNDRIQYARLPDGVTVVFGYQVGTTLHLTEVGSDGKLVQDLATDLGASAIFDRLRSLNNGLLEVEYRQPGTTANANTLNTLIFDTRTGLTASSLTGQFIAGQAGIAITTSSDNAVVIAKGSETITDTGKNGTISFEDSSAGVLVTLNANATIAAVTSGGDAAGDVIKGFVNIVGSQYADTLTGMGVSILSGNGGNDAINGQGTDTAAFRGDKSDYTIAIDATKGAYVITDNVQGRDGVDTLTGVKYLQFADQTVAIASMLTGAASSGHDFNGDGKSDILLQNAVDGSCYVWNLNNKALVDSGYVGWAPGKDWVAKGTGDFNGDGKSDILLQNAKDGTCYIWELNNKTLVDNGYVGWTPGKDWVAKGTGDFNGDGKSDVLLQNTNDGSCYIWELNGKGLVDSGFVGWTPGSAWQVKGTGDFNGDGKSDILLQYAGDGSCFIWELNSKTLVDSGYVGWAPGKDWVAKGTGDFNGDGKSDVLLQNATDGSCYIWELNGKSLVDSGFVGWTPGAAWQVKGTGDFNGDGKSDILLRNATDGSCYVWELNNKTLVDHGYVGWAPGLDWQATA